MRSPVTLPPLARRWWTLHVRSRVNNTVINILATVKWIGQSCAMFSSSKNVLCKKKKIHRHIKLAIHAWSTKCRWNQKLIVQLGCTLRDERFEPN
jgi:hypothetical protein